ncbi:MAG: hypothetical protein GKR93_01700 [Gammaproteobacteria bacterium]|nr:hypothetical protein [Gammaproteobacteria bacterium]
MPFRILVFLSAAILLSACSSTSLKNRVLGKSNLEILSENIIVDESSARAGEILTVNAGVHEVVFEGELVFTELIPNAGADQKPKTSMDGLACAAFLPLCLLSKIASTTRTMPKKSVSNCIAKLVFIADAGHSYSVKTATSNIDVPLLVVRRDTHERFDVATESMKCEKREY